MYNKEDSELNDIIEGFQILGSDSGGLVNPTELKEIMDIMNMSDKNPFLYNIIQTLCSDQEIQEKGGIEAKDFISLLNQELDDTSTNEGLQKIFSIFANPSTNTIPLPVFSQIIGEGDNFNEEEKKIKKLVLKPEINGKELDFNEFQDIVKTEIPRQTSHENIVYKKKPSSTVKKFIYNEDNNKINENNINKVEINFSNNIINNNSNYNSINVMDSLDLSEKNSEKYINGNKISENINKENNNEDIKFSYKKPKLDKNYSNEKNIKNQYNNIDINNDDITHFDNIKEKHDETEISISKKKYRHMRKSHNKDLQNEKPEEEKENDEEQKEVNYFNNKKYTKGRIENNNNDSNKKNNNKNDDNEEKNDVKTERRYHRRYRDIKSSTPDKKEEKNNSVKENNKGMGYSKYRRKK